MHASCRGASRRFEHVGGALPEDDDEDAVPPHDRGVLGEDAEAEPRLPYCGLQAAMVSMPYLTLTASRRPSRSTYPPANRRSWPSCPWRRRGTRRRRRRWRSSRRRCRPEMVTPKMPMRPQLRSLREHRPAAFGSLVDGRTSVHASLGGDNQPRQRAHLPPTRSSAGDRDDEPGSRQRHAGPR